MDDYKPPIQAYFTEEELNAPSLILPKDKQKSSESKVILFLPKDKQKRKKPGVCVKCGEHIGRGITWHEKACKG